MSNTNRTQATNSDTTALKQPLATINVAASALLGSREGSRSNLFQAEPSFDSSLLASEIKKKSQSKEHLQEVSLSLKKTSLVDAVKPPVYSNSSAKAAQAISPKTLVEKLATSPSKTLLLDVRSLQEFFSLRIKNSANIILPGLILKRIKKGGISSFQLENFLTNDESKSVFQAWTNLEPNGCSIVVYDDEVEEDPNSDSHILLKGILGSQLLASRPSLDIYFLNGGLRAFSKESSAQRFLEGTQVPHHLPELIHHGMMEVNTANISGTQLQLNTSPSSVISDYSTPALTISGSSPVSTTFSTVAPTAGAIEPISSSQKSPFKSTSLPVGTPSSSLSTPSSAKSAKRSSFTITIAPTPTTTAAAALQQQLHTLGSMPETSSPETISKPEHVSIITEYLCLGSEVVPTASNAVHQLKEMNITHVLNMAKEVRDEALMVGDASTLGIEFKWIGVYDHPDEEIDGPLREGVAFIDDARKSNPGAIVLVHCKAGRSRSVAVVLAYLIMVQKMTLKAAYELVSTKRNGIIPNIGFMLALLHIELETLGYNTEVSGSSLNGMKSI